MHDVHVQRPTTIHLHAGEPRENLHRHGGEHAESTLKGRRPGIEPATFPLQVLRVLRLVVTLNSSISWTVWGFQVAEVVDLLGWRRRAAPPAAAVLV